MALFIALGAVRQAICKLWWFERYNGIGHTFRLIIISQSWGIPSMRNVIGRKFLKRISFFPVYSENNLLSQWRHFVKLHFTSIWRRFSEDFLIELNQNIDTFYAWVCFGCVREIVRSRFVNHRALFSVCTWQHQCIQYLYRIYLPLLLKIPSALDGKEKYQI